MKKHRRIRFYRVKTWQLLVILVPLLFIDATLLRLDHIKMTELRDAVLVVDEQGNDDEVIRKLEELKKFVFSNIVINIIDENGNKKITFGTGPFYLEHQYIRAANRALEEAKENLVSDNNPNGNIYALASEACKEPARINGWTWDSPGYINCMLSEIQKYPAAEELHDKVIAEIPSTELFRKNYASPILAPTLTGFMIVLTLIILVVIFIRVIIWIFLRLSLIFA